jgi:hypothetical protein
MDAGALKLDRASPRKGKIKKACGLLYEVDSGREYIECGWRTYLKDRQPIR